MTTPDDRAGAHEHVRDAHGYCWRCLRDQEARASSGGETTERIAEIQIIVEYKVVNAVAGAFPAIDVGTRNLIARAARQNLMPYLARLVGQLDEALARVRVLEGEADQLRKVVGPLLKKDHEREQELALLRSGQSGGETREREHVLECETCGNVLHADWWLTEIRRPRPTPGRRRARTAVRLVTRPLRGSAAPEAKPEDRPA